MLLLRPTTEGAENMVRSVVSKVAWVGRATVFMMGLSVILALVLGVATTALAGTGVGAVFNLGQLNTVNKISHLVGSTTSPMLRIDNNGTGPAFSLDGPEFKPPMVVSPYSGTARNLSADKLDGIDSSEFTKGYRGTAALGFTKAGGKVLFNRVEPTNDNTVYRVFDHPKFGAVQTTCGDNQFGSGSRLVFSNFTSETLRLIYDDGAADPTYVTVPPTASTAAK